MCELEVVPLAKILKYSRCNDIKSKENQKRHCYKGSLCDIQRKTFVILGGCVLAEWESEIYFIPL